MISVQVLNEFGSVATRRFGLAIPEVREILATICAICTVKPLDVETHEAALDLAERHRLSIYDALILAAALGAGCAVLLTEDMQRTQVVGPLTIQNPFISGIEYGVTVIPVTVIPTARRRQKRAR